MLGYPGELKTGDAVHQVKPGTSNEVTAGLKEGLDSLAANCRHKPACTYKSYEDDCSRIIVIPVLSQGKNTESFKVAGFTAFFIEESSIVNDSIQIKGKFIKHAVKADLSDGAQDYGLAGIRVIGS
jgi:hypothetical protein